MGKKLKGIFNALTTLAYLFMIGTLILNHERYHFEEEWLFLLNIFLLCVGFYNFVERNNKQ